MKLVKVSQRFVDDNNTINWKEIEIEVPDDFDEEKNIVPFENYKDQ